MHAILRIWNGYMVLSNTHKYFFQQKTAFNHKIPASTLLVILILQDNVILFQKINTITTLISQLLRCNEYIISRVYNPQKSDIFSV